jgi:hypothetical protein
MLEREYAYFQANRAEFLEKFPARFVLIIGEKLVGDFGSRDDAILEGQRISTPGNYLVTFVGPETQQPMRFNPWVGLVGAPQ